MAFAVFRHRIELVLTPQICLILHSSFDLMALEFRCWWILGEILEQFDERKGFTRGDLSSKMCQLGDFISLFECSCRRDFRHSVLFLGQIQAFECMWILLIDAGRSEISNYESVLVRSENELFEIHYEPNSHLTNSNSGLFDATQHIYGDASRFGNENLSREMSNFINDFSI